MREGIKESASELRLNIEGRAENESIEKLIPRSDYDPERLHGHVMKKIKNYFSTRGLTYIPGQEDLLSMAVKTVLRPTPGTVTAIPFQPGLGKSTLIRALLEVFANEFRAKTPIANVVGGVIVVVEKTAEAEELAELCNVSTGHPAVAMAISAPNDYNLSQGRCLNGSAMSYAECMGRSCPDYEACPLAQSPLHTMDTPILIMLHARYQRYMEDMNPFLTWEDERGQHCRKLLLVDELPPMIEDNALNLSKINEIESSISQYKPSYQKGLWKEKSNILYEWNGSIRIPYFKLAGMIRRSTDLFGILSRKEMEEAGLASEILGHLTEALTGYLGTTDHTSIRLAEAFRTADHVYYAVGQDFTLFAPRLKKLGGSGQPATFVFSGTASLAPELSRNPDVFCFKDQKIEPFDRLQINIQRGDLFNVSRSGMVKKQNLAALSAWLQFIIPQLILRHKRILAVTYKPFAAELWSALRPFHDFLIPYTEVNGMEKPMLPYFGGLNGSNLYQESTCVICIGLNRFEPKDYISRTLALDFDGSYTAKINEAMEAGGGNPRLSRVPCVMDMQDISLAQDLVQLVFRSALRKHGENLPIEFWLLQPPNGVVKHLLNYFGDCQVQEYNELPEQCQIALTASKAYQGERTNSAKLIEFLTEIEDGTRFTPGQVRDATGLTKSQFKEAKKNKAVKEYFDSHIETKGSGKNTTYCKVKLDSLSKSA